MNNLLSVLFCFFTCFRLDANGNTTAEDDTNIQNNLLNLLQEIKTC